MNTEEKIARLEDFKQTVERWDEHRAPEARTFINQNTPWARREVVEADCFHTVTIGPPPAVGGLVMRNIDPFTMLFNPPYGMSMADLIVDMLDQTIGVLRNPRAVKATPAKLQVDMDVRRGYAFIAMPMDASNHALEDVLDAVKEAATRCGIHAERVDEPASNERITDRVLESIRKAEYVIADLTYSRPNVFYEAGFAQGLGKTPIYVARAGTELGFDLKDYPVIFFKSMKELKDSLEKRLRGLAAARAA